MVQCGAKGVKRTGEADLRLSSDSRPNGRGRQDPHVNVPAVRGRTTALLSAQPLWLRLTGGVLLAIAAFALSVAMRLPEQGYTFLLLYPVVIASAYLAEREAGLAATAAAALCVAARMLLTWDSANDLLLVQIASLLLFVMIGWGSSILMSRLKRALRDLELSNEQLLRANEAARAAGEETDLLLRELRHRVRNDVSNVIAILRLQAKSCTQEAATHLVSAAERLQVLANVHQRLSRQGHSPVVEMKGFVEELCAGLRATLLPLKPVALETQIDEVRLPSERAVAVGLIINELVTNAIKYAYPDDAEGAICVCLGCVDATVEILVEDDGIGMPPEAFKDSGGLGQRLVRSLAAQLGGGFECSVDPPGTRCTVVFPRQNPATRERRAIGTSPQHSTLVK